MKSLKKTISALALMLCLAGGYANAATPKDVKTNSDVFMFQDKMEWEKVGDGVTRQIVGYNGTIMMAKVKFEKGGIGTPHRHYHTQLTYVAKGKFKFTVGGKTKIVKEGDSLYMEPNVEHGCVCLEAGLLIDCFSPMRADFIGLK